MVDTVSNINLNSENIIRFTCSVGDKLKICQPISYPPVDFAEDADPDHYLAGFIVLDQTLGKFDGMADGSNMCVYYVHEYSGQQIIQYSSKGLGSKQFYLVLDGMTVHDHASIPQGGPAYATYYAQSPEEES